MSDNNITKHRANNANYNNTQALKNPSSSDKQSFKLQSTPPPKELWVRALNNIKFYDNFVIGDNGSVDTDFSGNGNEFKNGDKKGIIKSLQTLANTPRGKEMLNNIANDSQPLNITSNMNNGGPFMEREHNLIHFDGRDRYNKTLKMAFPASVILGHEMGHLKIGGFHQDHVGDGLAGGGPTNNVEATENPIRKALKLPLREYYIEKQGTESKKDDKCYSANGQSTSCPKKLGY